MNHAPSLASAGEGAFCVSTQEVVMLKAKDPDYSPPRTARQIKRQAQRLAALPPPKDYPEREVEPWKPLG